MRAGFGIRFILDDAEECLARNVQYEGDVVHLSFVVIKSDMVLIWWGLLVNRFMLSMSKTSEKYEFTALKEGVYRFCFKNKALATIDCDVYIGHFLSYSQHATDEHSEPLLEQISKLEEVLYSIQFEQHWLEAQTDGQALVNDGMSRRALHKAILESLLLISVSFLQVYFLQQLVERKLRV